MQPFESLFLANSLVVLTGTALLGLACGTVGTFAVLRRRALIGDALAHAALPGICTSFLLFQERSFPLLFAGAVIFGLISVYSIHWICSASRIKEDAAIAIVLSTFFGLGITLSRIIQNQPSGNRAGLDDFIFGRAASMVRQDVYFIGSASLLSLIVVALLYKELKLLCFDREFAWTQGFPVRSLDMILMTLICLCTVVGLPAVGVVLVSALLIFPAATARLWTDRFGVLMAIAGLLGLLACLAGTALSAILPGLAESGTSGFPTGPLIVIICAVGFTFSFLFAPGRGLIAKRLRAIRFRAERSPVIQHNGSEGAS